jgi:hypothetical protein
MSFSISGTETIDFSPPDGKNFRGEMLVGIITPATAIQEGYPVYEDQGAKGRSQCIATFSTQQVRTSHNTP